MPAMIETNNVVERLAEWLKATAELAQSPDVDPAAFMELVGKGAAGLLTEVQSLSDRIDVLEGENAALREKRKLKVVPAPPVVFEDETASLTQGGKTNG